MQQLGRAGQLRRRIAVGSQRARQMGEHGARGLRVGAALLKLSWCLAVRRGRVTGARGMSWYDNNAAGSATETWQNERQQRGDGRGVEECTRPQFNTKSRWAVRARARWAATVKLWRTGHCWLPSGCCWDWGTLRLACRRKSRLETRENDDHAGLERQYRGLSQDEQHHCTSAQAAFSSQHEIGGSTSSALQASATVTAVRLSLSAGHAQLR
jgi:hypothetical protein